MRAVLNLKIGVRLGFGFGVLISIMLIVVSVALLRFSDVNLVNDRIIEKDWVKAESANIINATTRANARNTMELLISEDIEQTNKIKKSIESNKRTIDVALEKLDQLI